MFDLQSAKFVSTVAAPQQPLPEPAYWFLFQQDKLLVHPAPYMAHVPRALDVVELTVTPVRTQYMGYLKDAHGGQAHCYSGELDAAQAIPNGMIVPGAARTARPDRRHTVQPGRDVPYRL